MLGELLAILAPVFLTAGLGFGWARLGRDFDVAFVSRLVVTVASPCLAFSTLTDIDVPLSALITQAGTAALGMAAFAALGAGALKLAGVPVARFLPVVVFPNTGNMGLPLCLFAFGPEGLALAIGFTAMVMIGNYTVGVALAGGAPTWGAIARTPLIHAIALALVFLLTGTSPPDWLANTTRILGDMMIPLMLMSLGVSLASLKVGNLRRATGLAALRLGLGIPVGLGLGWALGLSGAAAGVALLQCSMPSAILNYMFSARYAGPTGDIAGSVVVSTLAALALLPGLLILAKML